MSTLTLKTATQAMIFEAEIKGQISDGMWENSSGDSWKTWSRVTVAIGDEAGRDFYVSKTGFALHRLVEIIGYRMIRQAKIALAFSHVSDFGELHMLEYAGRDFPSRSTGFWFDVSEAITRHGGHDAIVAEIEAAVYDEKALRKDLTEIKKAMRTKRSA